VNAPRFLILLVALSCVSACSKNKSSAPPFAFNRPEHLGFVCIDPLGNGNLYSTEADPHDATTLPPLVLPLRCCADQSGFNKADPLKLYAYDWDKCPHNPGHPPVLHALVTQSTRGEVAAVDLVASTVIDSDPRVPGYTFVDVGGLPTAIVVPPEQPRARGTPAPARPTGPRWTYVTSGEELYIRAIPTCHFRPECTAPESSGPDKLPLPGIPHDMVLIDDALWLALPDLGAIARIQLPADDHPDDKSEHNPFKVDANGKLIPPTYFAVAGLGPAVPAAPIREADPYLAACGLGYVMDGAPHAPPADPKSSDKAVENTYKTHKARYEANVDSINTPLRPIELPNAPVMVPTLGPHPTRMRYDVTHQLLFVADREQPAVRAYAIDDKGALQPRGVLLTGGPVRDFTLTPDVPGTVSKSPLVPNTPTSFTDTTRVRYLYAIDDRDGSVLVQSLSFAKSGEVVGQPLILPFSLANSRYGDRLTLPTGSGLALDAVDTRDKEVLGVKYGMYDFGQPSPPLTKLEEDGFYNDLTGTPPDNVDGDIATATQQAQTAVDKAQSQYNAALDKYNKNPKDLALLDDWRTKARALQEAARGLDGWKLRAAYAASAGAYQMRGVAVIASTAAGALFAIDVHDLDMFARAKQYCANDGAEGLTDDASALPLAVRRHALRLLLGADISVSTTSSSLLEEVVCPDGYRALMSTDGQDVPSKTYASGLLCTARDPWRSAADLWTFSYEGPFTGVIAGYFASDDAGAKPGQSALYAPPGYDLCGHGVMARDLGRKNPMGKPPGDVIAVRTTPKRDVAGCTIPDAQDPPRFAILAAYRDHLIIGASEAELGNLKKCYPDLIGFDVRASNEFVVSSASGYPHNVTSDPADESGHCILDPKADPLRTSRTFGAEPVKSDDAGVPPITQDADGGIVEPSDVFQNQSLALRLSATARTRGTASQLSIGQSIDYAHSAVYDSSQGRLDSLPVTVYFEPYTLDLYVVDTASQGLRRISLTPFGGVTSGFQ
jgi:hypothetical protein